MAERKAADAIANFSRLEKPEIKKDHELKAVDVAQKINVRKLKDAIRFTPEITPDEKADAQLILGANDVGRTEDGTHVVSVPPDSIMLTNTPTDADDPNISASFPSPVEVVEEMPQFPGGLKALMQWLDKNIVYPPICIRDKVEGRVEVSFFVDQQGNVKNPQVTKGVHPLLDREALLTVKRMPKWMPGKVNGKFSVVRVTIPVEFTL